MSTTAALTPVAARPQEEELISSENSASIFNTLSDLPSQLRDGAELLGEAMRLAGMLSQETLEAQRHKHLAYILNEQAQLNNGNSVALNPSLNKVRHGCRRPAPPPHLLRVEPRVCLTHGCCARSGGEETVPAQEVHPHLPVVRRGRGGLLEIQEHKADGAGGGAPRGHRTHGGALPLFGPAPLQHRE